MKVEQIDKFVPDDEAHEAPYTTFCYFEPAGSKDNDVLFVGSQNGEIGSFDIARRLTRHNLRADSISKGSGHSGTVICLVYTLNPKLCHSAKSGLLISGSSDRTIKIWSPQSFKPLVQTLVGHNGSIASVADGGDGTLVSCAVDGSIRVWTLQRGRQLMLHPFFECTFTLAGSKDDIAGSSWLNAMTISTVGMWSCFIGDMSGNIDVYRKGNESNEVDGYVAAFTGQLNKYARWQHVHRLGISHLVVASEDNYLVTLSYDCSCRILDATQGQTIFLIENPRRCMYTGVLWSAMATTFTFVDELGNLDIFSALSEKIKDSAVIIAPNARQQKSIMNSHKNPMLSTVAGYKDNLLYLSLIPERGHIILWQACMDDKCVEYFGHTDAIINVAVLPQFEYQPVTAASVLTASKSDTSSFSMNPQSNVNDTLALLVANTKSASFSLNNNMPASRSNSLSNTQQALMNMKSDSMTASKGAINICKDENLFFSCSVDGILRCWDEFLKTEQYQFRCNSREDPTGKAKSNKNYHMQQSHHIEITFMLMLWDFNTIVTGSEDGSVCLWNADLGNKLMSRVLKHAISSIVYGKTKKCEALVAADISGQIAMWNLTMFRRNSTQLELTDLIEVSMHAPEEPGIACLAFHDASRVMFSGGHDGTIRYWRLNTDSEACCLKRPPDGFLQTAVAVALEVLEKTSVNKQTTHTHSSATSVTNTLETGGSIYSIDSMLDDQSVESDTSSVINYRNAKNAYQSNEAICAIQTTPDFLLSGDDGGELILWSIFTTEVDTGSNTNHYYHHQETPCIVVLPLCRFHNNIHNPTKAVMCIKQASATDAYIVQGGCGKTPNRISVWKIAMKPLVINPNQFKQVLESGSQSPYVPHSDHQVLIQHSQIGSNKYDGVLIRDGKMVNSPKNMTRKEKAEFLKQTTKKPGVIVPETHDVYHPEESQHSQHVQPGHPGALHGHEQPMRTIPGSTFGSMDYGDDAFGDVTDVRVIDGKLDEEIAVLNSSMKGSRARAQKGSKLRTKHTEYEVLLQAMTGTHAPIIPSLSYLSYNKYVLFYLQNVQLESVNSYYNHVFSNVTIQPSCVELVIVSDKMKKKPVHTGNVIEISNSNTKTIVLPQYVYVGLMDGPIYKIVVP